MTVLNKKTGFTLIETLIAVLLLATAITGPLTLASRSLVAAVAAKDQITAYYLAQDAVEYVRFARDTNRLQGFNWISGGPSPGVVLTPCTSNTAGCYVDTTAQSPVGQGQTPTGCGNTPAVCRVMNYDTTNNRFTYTDAAGAIVKSPYTRAIQIAGVVNNANERKVTVTVSWKAASGVSKQVVIQENLLDWQ